MKVRDLIATLMSIKEENVDVLDSNVFFLVKGEDNLVEVNGLTYDDEGDITLHETAQGEEKEAEETEDDAASVD